MLSVFWMICEVRILNLWSGLLSFVCRLFSRMWILLI